MNFTFSNNLKKPNILHIPKLAPPDIKPEISQPSSRILNYNMFDRVQNISPCKNCGK